MRRGLIIVLIAALMLIGGVRAASAAPVPEKCRHGIATMPGYIPKAAFNHVAPCRWLIKFESKGIWDISGDVGSITMAKSFWYPACKKVGMNNLRTKPGCAMWIYAGPGVEPGTSYTFTITRVK